MTSFEIQSKYAINIFHIIRNNKNIYVVSKIKPLILQKYKDCLMAKTKKKKKNIQLKTHN